MRRYSRKKRIIFFSVAIVLVTGVTIAILLGVSNYLIKHELERMLGADFRVERISLGWGSVGVYKARFLKDGQTAAYAKRIILKTHFFTLFEPGFSVSSAVLEEPSLKLEVSKSGEWVVPMSIPQLGPIYVKQIVVKDGALFFQDHRFQDPNHIEAQKINARLDDVSIPPKNAPSKFALQTDFAGELISGLVISNGAFNFGTLGIDIKFEVQNLTRLDESAAGPAFRVESMSFTATSEGILTKPLFLTDFSLTRPYVRLERDPKGIITSPLTDLIPRETGQEKERTTEGQVEVKNLKIAGGELLFLDGEIGKPPFPIRLTDIALNADILSFPLEGRYTNYEFSGRIPGNDSTGVLISSGRTDLSTLDTNGHVSLSTLDLTALKPYLVKPGDVDVSRGFLDLSMDLNIKQGVLYSPAHAVIKDLEFVPGSGLKDEFLGIPRSLIVKTLETSNHRIGFDFIFEGSLENPEFNFRGSLAERFIFGLAKSLGLPLIDAGETVILQGGRTIRDVGKELQKLFK
jgi:hypothetical protein